jgi:hypothetical protein
VLVVCWSRCRGKTIGHPGTALPPGVPAEGSSLRPADHGSPALQLLTRLLRRWAPHQPLHALLATGTACCSPRVQWRCDETGVQENLWLNLSTGFIGSGRAVGHVCPCLCVRWCGCGLVGEAARVGASASGVHASQAQRPPRAAHTPARGREHQAPHRLPALPVAPPAAPL